MNFIDKKVSVNRAIAILAKNGIQVDDEETAVILDFLYLMAKNYKKIEEGRNPESLERDRTPEKMQQKMLLRKYFE